MRAGVVRSVVVFARMFLLTLMPRPAVMRVGTDFTVTALPSNLDFPIP